MFVLFAQRRKPLSWRRRNVEAANRQLASHYRLGAKSRLSATLVFARRQPLDKQSRRRRRVDRLSLPPHLSSVCVYFCRLCVLFGRRENTANTRKHTSANTQRETLPPRASSGFVLSPSRAVKLNTKKPLRWSSRRCRQNVKLIVRPSPLFADSETGHFSALLSSLSILGAQGGAAVADFCGVSAVCAQSNWRRSRVKTNRCEWL